MKTINTTILGTDYTIFIDVPDKDFPVGNVDRTTYRIMVRIMVTKMIKQIVRKYFDYDIVGEYLEPLGNNRYQRKFIKRYYLKGHKRKRRWCLHGINR